MNNIVFIRKQKRINNHGHVGVGSPIAICDPIRKTRASAQGRIENKVFNLHVKPTFPRVTVKVEKYDNLFRWHFVKSVLRAYSYEILENRTKFPTRQTVYV